MNQDSEALRLVQYNARSHLDAAETKDLKEKAKSVRLMTQSDRGRGDRPAFGPTAAMPVLLNLQSYPQAVHIIESVLLTAV